MNLKKQIRRILKEEYTLSIFAKRSLLYIDDEVDYLLDNIYTPKKICRYENPIEFLYVIIEATFERMYYKYYNNIDDNSDEWGQIYHYIADYIKEKHNTRIMQYYINNCG